MTKSILAMALLGCLGTALLTAQQASEDSPSRLASQAYALLQDCQIETARGILLRSWSLAPEHAATVFGLGQSHLAENDYDPAIEQLTRATELDPTNAHYALALGRAQGRKARDAGLIAQISLAKRAREGFERAVELDQDLLEARLDLVEFYGRAPSMMGGGVDKAEAQVEEIANRDSAIGHQARAVLHRVLGRADEAVSEYQIALAATPHLVPAHLDLATLLLELDRYGEAAQATTELLGREPDSKLALHLLGRIAAEGAVELGPGATSLQRYLELEVCDEDPEHADALLLLGKIREHQGDRPAALAAYRKALVLRPKTPEATQAVRRLRKDKRRKRSRRREPDRSTAVLRLDLSAPRTGAFQ